MVLRRAHPFFLALEPVEISDFVAERGHHGRQVDGEPLIVADGVGGQELRCFAAVDMEVGELDVQFQVAPDETLATDADVARIASQQRVAVGRGKCGIVREDGIAESVGSQQREAFVDDAVVVGGDLGDAGQSVGRAGPDAVAVLREGPHGVVRHALPGGQVSQRPLFRTVDPESAAAAYPEAVVAAHHERGDVGAFQRVQFCVLQKLLLGAVEDRHACRRTYIYIVAQRVVGQAEHSVVGQV